MEKDFMIMKKISLCLLFLLPVVCGYGQADEPIPFANFSEIIINLTFPEYRTLKSDGGYVEIDGGVRGIIVYRLDATTFIAYERNCPYRPNEACARVDVDISKIFLIDRCCGSNFSLADGYVTNGPAMYPLRKYRAQLAGSTLTITDEIVN
jgi:nitrite reductase/ring-hydroxylating ferredoxin subunit